MIQAVPTPLRNPLEILSLWIPWQMPGLNEIIREKGRIRGKWNGYMTMKEQWGNRIAGQAMVQKFPKLERGHFTYVFEEPNRKRDPSNVIAGGIKLIEDALQVAELLPNDGWEQILSIRPYYLCIEGGKANVSLFVTHDEPLTFETAAYEHSKNQRPRYRGRK